MMRNLINGISETWNEFIIFMNWLVYADRGNWFLIDLKFATLGGIFALIVKYAGLYIWDPPQVILIIIFLVIAEWATNTAYKFKFEGIKTANLRLLALRMASYLFILMITHLIDKYVANMFWLPYVSVTPMIIATLFKILKNMTELGFINKTYSSIVLGFFDKQLQNWMQKSSVTELEKEQAADNTEMKQPEESEQ